ncbi:rhomboid family intramembrane serine protease [Aerococcus kribbianus]|uniref:Rhomboid family intramembrane serine protease n=1 Tax=Aerococcus kribbianus TaxID=2999064 RepID=A0A9X3FM77_9LACT|nr:MULTISPECIES: rhomboid family intramembrane serine protease [unclassified Aerococcus]MCZ0717102.1 rhomboid family intramembrane serine protease [Aerococcus sp. YH-aer221]MCZ0725390.1 rhomboid family intramembrane serine protease [Aerococcus sp. YH-aer222]
MNKRPFVSWLLLAIQLLVFVVMESVGSTSDTQTLILFGAKYAPLLALGQWWRLILPIFIHIGLSHLIINSLTLFFLGPMVERITGHFKFLLIYLAAGVMGNALSYQFSPSVSAGASTSLFGLFAVFIALAILYPKNHYFQVLGKQYRTLIIVNIILNVFSSGVDLWGHVGGMLGGMLFTFVIMAGQRDSFNWGHRALALLGYGAILAFILMNHGIYNLLI